MSTNEEWIRNRDLTFEKRNKKQYEEYLEKEERFKDDLEEIIDGFKGRTIQKVYISDKIPNTDNIFPSWSIIIEFTDGTGVFLVDNQPICCEDRYIKTEDNLEYLVGSRFHDVVISETLEDQRSIDDIKETTFIRILTDKAPAVFCAYNIHSGCYSGLDLTIGWFIQ